MILVESSVWIDFLTHQPSPHRAHFGEILRLAGAVGVPGPVVQEVLQGIRDPYMFEQVRQTMEDFPIFHAQTSTYLRAARLYRQLRTKGATVPSGDVTIAAIAIETDHELYTLDHHFQRIAQHSALRLHHP